MQYHLSRLPKSEVEITVTLPFSEFEPYLSRAAALISEEVEIEGFRKGKAPYDIVKNRVGEHAIYERAAELAVRKTYPAIIAELKTENRKPKTSFIPIGRPQVEIAKLAPGNELAYRAKVATLPAVALPDVAAIARRVRADKKPQAVGEDEIRKAIEWLRESRTQLVTVDRPAQEGDRVEVDFAIRHAGVKVAGGDSKNHPLVIGQKKFIPGFEEGLIGMQAGGKKDFALITPENWHEKSFAGKRLDITAEMRLVQERRLPDRSDEFAKGIGNFDSFAGLEASVREGLAAEKEEKETQRIRSMMVEEIARQAALEVPDVLIEAELDKMIEELRRGITDLGMQWDDYLVHIKKNREDLRREWREEAERRVRLALTLREIAAEKRIEPSEEEAAERENRILAQFKTAAQAEKAIDPAELREYTKGVLRNEKVFEWLETI